MWVNYHLTPHPSPSSLKPQASTLDGREGRWVNYHLKAAGCARELTNFGADIKDSEIYTYLMAQICPEVDLRSF